MEPVLYSTQPSPIGELGLVATPAGRLLKISFLAHYSSTPHWTDTLAAHDFDPRRDDAALQLVRDQLSEYFGGDRTSFDLAFEPRGADFERAVWRLLQEIPYGETRSYGELADVVADADAARAVGGAVGHNPLPIVIPCHRVIGADGSLVGYGGGLRTKEWLLVHEGALLCPLPRPTGS